MKLYQLGVVSLVMFAAAHGNHHDGRDKDHGVELDHHRPMVSHEVKEAMPADNSRHKEPKFKHTDRNDHKYLHNTNSETSKASNAESKDVASLWIKAIASTLLISLAPIFILYFIPLGDGDKTGLDENLLKVLLAFAAGGLLGDALLHLVPHSIHPHSHTGEVDSELEHSHDHSHGHGHSHSHSHGHDHGDSETQSHNHMSEPAMVVGLWVLAGIFSFLVIEKIVRSAKGGHGHSHGTKQEGESQGMASISPALTRPKSKARAAAAVTSPVKSRSKSPARTTTGQSAKASKSPVRTRTGQFAKSPTKAKSGVNEAKQAGQNSAGEISVSGYLNLAADFAHNFTDGLAIGAQFLYDEKIAYVTVFTILLHEVSSTLSTIILSSPYYDTMTLHLVSLPLHLLLNIVLGFFGKFIVNHRNLTAAQVPHEIGDFAILVQSGCTKGQAMQMQAYTAIGAMFGTVCGLIAGELAEATAWILPFTAGGFIYIATTSIIPELLEDSSLLQSVKELTALTLGVLTMVLIVFIE